MMSYYILGLCYLFGQHKLGFQSWVQKMKGMNNALLTNFTRNVKSNLKKRKKVQMFCKKKLAG